MSRYLVLIEAREQPGMFDAAVTGDPPRCTAHWYTTHASNGASATAADPIAALRALADELERHDKHAAVINAIDSGDDDRA